MMRFNRGFGLIARNFGGGKVDPSIPQVQDFVENKQLRDKLHLPFLSENEKTYLYQQNRVRSSTALYNIMASLPNSFTNFFAKFVSDPKIHLKSDNLHLPRLTKNGVPVYDSTRVSNYTIFLRSTEGIAPILFLANVHYPVTMLLGFTFGYFVFYKHAVNDFANGFVVKMELVPQTQQLLIQKVGRFGCIKTSRIKINDIQAFDRSKLNAILYKATRSLIDRNLIFRVKSTGELLFFDPQGYWYEQGINHELLI